MLRPLFKLLLLIAVVFQSSPVRACEVEKAVTGENCHDQRADAEVWGEVVLHCDEADRPSGLADDSPECIPCQPNAPAERQLDSVRVDLTHEPSPVLRFEVSNPICLLSVGRPTNRVPVVGRILPLLI